MKTRHARKIRRGVMASKLFWQEFYAGQMSQERYSKWLAVLISTGKAGEAATRTEAYYRRKYKQEAKERG